MLADVESDNLIGKLSVDEMKVLSDLVLLHPYSIDREEIELKTFFRRRCRSKREIEDKSPQL